MKIIFEGPDGGGKSTAIGFIQARTTLDIFVSGGPVLSRDDFNNRFEELLRLSIRKETLLMDRCWIISEKIYSKIFNRTPIILPEEYLNIENLFLSDALIVYCNPDWEKQAEYHDPEFNRDHRINGGQLEYRKKVSRAYETYFKELEKSAIVLRFDYTKESLESLWGYIGSVVY